ncbi:MAG: hypothetical protein IKI75_03845 [Lachnospiraceae bacterium]|nr:hypothetical protein [Lachnospiraceae bacterium]
MKRRNYRVLSLIMSAVLTFTSVDMPVLAGPVQDGDVLTASFDEEGGEDAEDAEEDEESAEDSSEEPFPEDMEEDSDESEASDEQEESAESKEAEEAEEALEEEAEDIPEEEEELSADGADWDSLSENAVSENEAMEEEPADDSEEPEMATGNIERPWDHNVPSVDDDLTIAEVDEMVDGEAVPAEELKDGDARDASESADEDGIIIRAESETIRIADEEMVTSVPAGFTENVESAYPAAYTETETINSYLATISPTRDQNPFGTCWAHAATALSELYAEKVQGKNINAVDYSERHLAHYTYAQGTLFKNNNGEVLVPDPGDSITETMPEYVLMEKGGNVGDAARNLIRWRGVAAESTVPYPTNLSSGQENKLDPFDYNATVEYDDVVRLENCYIINPKENPSILKSYIKEYGGAAVSYYHPGNSYTGSGNSGYYNSETNAFYFDQETGTNHAVTIVGWDDSFPSTNFNASHQPSKNGAWLIRNSWSAGNSKLGSYYTYFWMSYEDKGLSESAYVYKLQDDDMWLDNNYSYNSQYSNYGGFQTPADKAANVFTANGAEAHELLEAVTVQAMMAKNGNIGYRVEIYTGLTDDTDPTSGVLASAETGTLPFRGVYTIRLDEPVRLSKGEKYSVVVEFSSAMPDYETDTEYSEGEYKEYVTTGCGAEGQSFYCKDGAWLDMYAMGHGNFCINAQTNDIAEDEIVGNLTGSYNTGSGVTLSWNAAEGAVGYRVFRGLSAEGALSKLADVSDETAYLDTDVSAGTVYYYRVLRLEKNNAGEVQADLASASDIIAVSTGNETQDTDLTVDDFNISTDDLIWDGNKKIPAVTKPEVYKGNITLYYAAVESKTSVDEPTDWTAIAPARIGCYQVKIKADACGAYKAAELTSSEWRFSIVSYDLANAEVKLSYTRREYDGNGDWAEVVSVSMNGQPLSRYTHYSISYLYYPDSGANESATDAGTYRVTITAKDNSGYTGKTARAFYISKRLITVTAQSPYITEGNPLPELTYTYTGVLDGQTAAFTGSLSVNATGEEAGEYKITQGTLALKDNDNGSFKASNYRIVYVPGTLTVEAGAKIELTESNTSVTLGQESYEYTGSGITPLPLVKYGETQLIIDKDYTLSYEDNIHSGEQAIVTVSGKGKYTGEVSKYFTIRPKSVTITGVGAADKIYDGTVTASFNGTAVVAGKLDDDDVTVVFGTAAFDDKDAGEGKTVSFSGFSLGGTASGNYILSAQPVAATAAITRKEVSLNWSSTEFTYNGEAQCPEAAAGGLVGNDACSVTVTGAKTDAGNYTATATGLSNSNYKLPAAVTTAFSIEEADAALTKAPSANELSYTGSSQKLITAGTAEGGDLLYAVTAAGGSSPAAGDYSKAIPERTEAGIYKVWYMVRGDKNHNDLEPESLEVGIGKAVYSGTVSAGAIVQSGAAVSGVEVTLPEPPNGASYAKTGTAGGDTPALISGTPAVNGNTLNFDTTAQEAGTTATITIAVTGAKNYKDYEVVVTVISKNRSDAGVSITGGDQSVTYGDTGVILSAEITDEGEGEGRLSWSSSEPSVASIVESNGRLTINKAGTTVISVTYGSDTTVGEAQITLTVNPKLLSISWNGTELPYNGEAQQPEASVTGIKSGDACSVIISGEGTDVGSYTATASLAGSASGNYALKDSESSCSFSIVKADISGAELSLGDELVYNGSEQTMEVTKVELGGKDISAYCDISGNKATVAGSYILSVTAKENSNYCGTVTAEYSVAKCEITPTVSVSGDFVYTGEAVTPEYSVKNGDEELPAEEYSVSVSDNIHAGKGKLSVTASEDGNYSFDEITVEFDIAKAAHEDASVSTQAARGSFGTVDLNGLLEEGGSPAVLSVSDDAAVLFGTPSFTGGIMSFSFYNDGKLSGKSALVIVGVSGCTDYEDYQIVVTLTVNSCDHWTTEIRNAISENCTTDGYSGDIYCTICEELLEEGTVIPAAGHSFSGWTLIKEATAFEEGIEERSCVICGEKEQHFLDKLPSTKEEEELAEDVGEGAVSSNTTVITDEEGNVTGRETVTTISGNTVEKVVVDENGQETRETRIWVGGLLAAYHYTGEAIKPEFHVYDGLELLNAGKDYTVKYSGNKAVGGNATIILKFKGDYKDTPEKMLRFEIEPAELGADVLAAGTAAVADGKALTPQPSVFWAENGKSIKADNFSVRYRRMIPGKYAPVYDENDMPADGGADDLVPIGAELDSIQEAGTYHAIISPRNGNFTGSLTAVVTLVGDKKLMLSEASVKFTKSSYTYTGKEIIPAEGSYTLKLGGVTLREGTDYRVSEVIDNVEPGKATVIFEAVEGNAGGYAGSKQAKFTITKGRVLERSSDFEYIYDAKAPYEQGGARPELKIKDCGETLTEGVDYSVSYSKNKAAGSSGVITVKGKGNYKGSVTLSFTVVKKDIATLSANITAADKVVSNKGYKDPSVTVLDLNGKKLKAGKDFEVLPGSYTVDSDVITAVLAGKGQNYEGSISISYRYISADRDLAKVKALKLSPMDFNGSEVTLTAANLTNKLYKGSKSSPDYLVPGKNFVVESYSKNDKSGTAKVTLRGIGEYGGSKTLSFKITPRNGDYAGALVDGEWKK